MAQDRRLFRFDSNEKQKKIVRGTAIFIIVAFIGLVIYSVINLIVNADKTATIKILVAPSDATVTIDGRNYPTDRTIKIEPGTYAVKIEKDGFIPFNGSIKADADTTAYLYEYLNEENENGTYYKDNEHELSRTQRIADKKADIFQENYTGSDDIWNVTPYDDYPSGYKIYAEKEENGSVIVNIYLYTCDNSRVEKLKKKALEYLEEKKIDLNKYIVRYSNCG